MPILAKSLTPYIDSIKFLADPNATKLNDAKNDQEFQQYAMKIALELAPTSDKTDDSPIRDELGRWAIDSAKQVQKRLFATPQQFDLDKTAFNQLLAYIKIVTLLGNVSNMQEFFESIIVTMDSQILNSRAIKKVNIDNWNAIKKFALDSVKASCPQSYQSRVLGLANPSAVTNLGPNSPQLN